MAAPVAFSGLASGLDTTSLIAKLVAAEKSGEDQYTTEQTTISNQKSIVDDLTTSVASLGSLASNMALPSTLQLRTASSSDSHVSVAVSGSATPTVHDIRVNQLAASQVASSNTYASNTAGIAGAGTLQLTTGTTSATVTWDGTDTLSSIATKINDANAGATASVLFDGSQYRLMVSSKATGMANATSFVETGSALGLADPANVKVSAKDAKLTIDGVDIVRSSNIIDDALPGTTITANSLHAATEPDSSVTVSVDTAALSAQLQSFITSFNSIAGATATQLTYNATATTQSALFGDSTLRGLQSSMSEFTSRTFGTMNLTDLGVSMDENGMLSLDSDKLTTALQANPNAITDLFVTGGLATAVKSFSDLYSEPGDGVLVTKSAGMTDRNTLLQGEIDQIETNATALQTRLQDQFDALETAMSQLQGQSSYITQMMSQTSTTG
jgi:flagellar hook-associated protein 2